MSFAPFYTKNDRFTKTGSGQTQGKLKKRVVFSYSHRFDDCLSLIEGVEAVRK
jgi:hypothetical protein